MQTMEREIETVKQAETMPARGASQGVQYARAFAGLFLRDLHVLRREWKPFIVRVCMNPLLFLLDVYKRQISS